MYKLLGAEIRSGNLTEGFHVTSLEGLYLEGLYFIVVNCNQTETGNERVETDIWAQSSIRCNNKDNLRLPWRGSFV